MTVNNKNFYGHWAGHQVAALCTIHTHQTEAAPGGHFIFLAGDSSLDNKAWLRAQTNDVHRRSCVNGYQDIFEEDWMLPDVAYHMNDLLAQKGRHYMTINAAVEASTLAERLSPDTAYLQDAFIRDRITKNDILVVSVGANDVVLRPSLMTILNMAMLILFNSIDTINRGPDRAWGMNYFLHLFKTELELYVLQLIGNFDVRRVIVCAIYYPDETPTPSWANTVLSIIGYDRNPAKIQAIIKQIFEHASAKIDIPGVDVVPLPLFRTLDGSDSADYVARVEPSAVGGRKMAAAILNACFA